MYRIKYKYPKGGIMWFRKILISGLMWLAIAGLIGGIMLMGAWLSLFGMWVLWVGAGAFSLVITALVIYMIVGYPVDAANLEDN